MNLLTGEYAVTCDDKGRILLPAKLRAALDCDSLIVTQGFDKCLWLYTKSEWERVSERLMESSSPYSAKNRLVLRRFLAPAQEITLDRAGRLALPPTLRLYGGIVKDCTMLGVSKYIELWDSAAYSEYLKSSDKDFQEATEELAKIYF